MSTSAQRRAAGRPMRVVLAALVLTMFGLWQGWQCIDGMPMATPVMGVMTTTATHAPLDDTDVMAVSAHLDEQLGSQQKPDPPGGLMAACVTVLAGMLAALLFLAAPHRLMARLRVAIAAIGGRMPTLSRAPALAQLCVSRT